MRTVAAALGTYTQEVLQENQSAPQEGKNSAVMSRMQLPWQPVDSAVASVEVVAASVVAGETASAVVPGNAPGSIAFVSGFLASVSAVYPCARGHAFS